MKKLISLLTLIFAFSVSADFDTTVYVEDLDGPAGEALSVEYVEFNVSAKDTFDVIVSTSVDEFWPELFLFEEFLHWSTLVAHLIDNGDGVQDADQDGMVWIEMDLDPGDYILAVSHKNDFFLSDAISGINYDGKNISGELDVGVYSPDGTASLTTTTASVPEPAVIALFGLGLVSFGLSKRRKAI